MKTMVKLAIGIMALEVFCAGQAATSKFPPEVLARTASVVGVKTIPAGGTIKVDGTVAPTNPFILLKKDAPRILRFELAGYKALEKRVVPGNHYIMGIGVDFAHGRVEIMEMDELAAPGADPTGAQPAPVTNATGAQPASVAHSATRPPSTNPFGFEYRMTKEQVIIKIGRGAIKKESDTNVVFNTAPNPHPDFESYILFFSPDKGLLKVVALSKDIATSEDGSELRDKYNFFRSALQEKYGKPENDFDFCKGNEVECRSEYFMMELQDKNRYLNSFWKNSADNLPVHLETISIDAVASGLHSGYVTIGYEFEGWDAFVDQQNKKRNSPF